SRARASRILLRCDMQSSGPPDTRRNSHDESLGRPHPRHLSNPRVLPADAESAEAAVDVAANPAAYDDSHIDDPLKKHWIAIVVLFLVASGWGATFKLIMTIIVKVAPESFI